MSADIKQRLDELESLVREQQETIEAQRERIEELETRPRDGTETERSESSPDEPSGPAADGSEDGTPVSRRGALQAGGVLALAGLGVSGASGAPTGQVGTSGRPLTDLYAETLHGDVLTGAVTGGQSLTDIAGSNLSIDSNGTLNASDSVQSTSLSGGEGIDPDSITDGDTVSVAWGDATGLNSNGVANNFLVANDLDDLGNITDFSGAASLDSGGTVDTGRYMGTSSGTVDFVGPAEWDNGGDTSTNTASNLYATVAGGNSNTATGASSTVGGGDDNDAGGSGATVAGGQRNKATAGNTVVSGGANNESKLNGSTVGGGALNIADANYATIAGGNNNLVTGDYGTIAGGAPQNPPEDSTQNAVYDAYGTIGGGSNNQAGTDDGTANAQYATVPGGRNNTASGAYSTALGRNATASNDGAFVVGDSTGTEVTSQAVDEARFQGEVVSERFIESGSTYAFTDSVMTLNTFKDGDTGNDVFAVSVPSMYGILQTQFRVNEFGDTVVTGDLEVKANKNFVQPVETDDGQKEVVYTASEAAEARTEASGVATVEDGRAVIELPDHFGWVTSEDEPLVVQTTPYASDPVQPQVVERSTDRIVVEDFAGADEYAVSYTVKGTRAGYEDKQVVREPTTTGPSPAPADD